MSTIATIIKAMQAAGASPDLIVAAVVAAEAEPKPVRLSGRAWQELRILVFERDEYRCRYCGSCVADDPQADHIHPRSQGGADAKNI